jgi:hypothetical protein
MEFSLSAKQRELKEAVQSSLDSIRIHDTGVLESLSQGGGRG